MFRLHSSHLIWQRQISLWNWNIIHTIDSPLTMGCTSYLVNKPTKSSFSVGDLQKRPSFAGFICGSCPLCPVGVPITRSEAIAEKKLPPGWASAQAGSVKTAFFWRIAWGRNGIYIYIYLISIYIYIHIYIYYLYGSMSFWDRFWCFDPRVLGLPHVVRAFVPSHPLRSMDSHASGKNRFT